MRKGESDTRNGKKEWHETCCLVPALNQHLRRSKSTSATPIGFHRFPGWARIASQQRGHPQIHKYTKITTSKHTITPTQAYIHPHTTQSHMQMCKHKITPTHAYGAYIHTHAHIHMHMCTHRCPRAYRNTNVCKHTQNDCNR